MKVKEPLSSEFQLGYYVGEFIVHRFLPTIDVECQGATTQVIHVSDNDKAEYERLSDAHHQSYDRNNPKANAIEWEAYRKCSRELQEKYMPETLLCYLNPLTITNMDEFKLGLWDSLWNSDVCSYDIQPENIKIYDDITATGHIFFTIIEFKLRTE